MQNVAAMQCIRMENVLRRKVADQEQQMADQAQELKAQEQHMREQGEQMKGQVQQVVDLEHQVAGLHSKLKEEQKGKAAAVKVSIHQQVLQKLPYWLLSRLHMTTGFVTARVMLASYVSLRLGGFCTDVVCFVSLLITHLWPQKVCL